MALSELEQIELEQITREQTRRKEKKDSSKQFLSAVDQKIDEGIKERGTLQPGKQLKKVTEGGLGSKVIGGIGLLADPFQRAEATVANPALQLQRGNTDIGQLLNQALAGARGEKLGELGDVARGAGFGEVASATTGLIATLFTPIAGVNRALKSIKGLSKFTDKGIKSAGTRLAKGADDAVEVVGNQLDDVYKPLNNITGKPDKFLDVVGDLPKPLIKEIEEQVGKNIEDIVLEPTIQNMRKVKGIIGEFRPTAFGRDVRGAADIREGRKIVKAYAKSKNIIQETLKKKGLTKEARAILKADDAFVEVKRASNFVKGQIVDPKLLKPTKAGRTAQGIQKAGDITTRESLNLLKKTGKSANKNIKKAIDSLNRYNKIISAGKVGQGVLKAATYAATIGILLKTPARKLLRDED